ncbi:MAG: LD-carboxypeptidase [Clostridia bacterium]|nr:LD-carboxypeptidase [Clostridium sp.]
MNYPEKLKKGDTIGICAPSGGIAEKEDILQLELAENQLRKMGYKIIETKSVRKETKGRSASGKERAKEFMELLENEEVKLIIFAAGGDFLIEIFDYLDFEKIKDLKPKWLQGYSDITGISFLFNTILDIPTMYCQTIKDYAMNPLFKNLTDALGIEEGEEIVQKSFEKYQKVVDFRESIENENTENDKLNLKNNIEEKENTNSLENINDENNLKKIEGKENREIVEIQKEENYLEELTKTYELTEKVEWKNVTGEEKIQIKGRSLGGCLDCIKGYIGTKYDKVSEYVERHKKEGLIWFLEVFEMSTPEVYRTLWQMKNAGYFKYCTGIVFGRPLFIREDYETNFNDTVKEALQDLEIPIICDADIGHVKPQLAIVNGAILEITSQNGKGTVKTILE